MLLKSTIQRKSKINCGKKSGGSKKEKKTFPNFQQIDELADYNTCPSMCGGLWEYQGGY